MNTERYQRQLVLPDFGAAGQQRLSQAKILIIGAGGLGVPVMQYLAGMGVGNMTIMDADVVSLSNLQRQVLYVTEDVGKLKVEVAKTKLQQLNPEISISIIPEMLAKENAAENIASVDLVIDCTDSIEARYLINDACVEAGIPFIYGALYRHEGHVSVFNYQGNVSYRDVYPDDSAKVENCNEIGVLGVLPGMIGTYQAMEAVKVIANIGTPLSGKLLVVDALSSEHHVFELVKNPAADYAPTKPQLEEKWLAWNELEKMDLANYQLVDVRVEAEFEQYHDERFENVPMLNIPSFKPDKNVILVCNKGVTTRQASAILKTGYPDTEVYQMKGGYSSL